MSTPVYSKKHLATLVAAILVLSSSLAVYSFQGTGTAYGSYYDLGLSLSPEGSVKLGVAEPQEFVATVSGGSYPYTFVWTSQVHYKDNKTASPLEIKRETFTQDWTEKYFDNKKPVSTWTFDGFPCATEDYFTVMVEVQDATGAKQSEMCFVFDPYTSPTQYLNGANLAAFSYKIETDGLGWYRAVSGTDGAISFTSTNGTAVFQSTVNAMKGVAGPYGRTICAGILHLNGHMAITGLDLTNIEGLTIRGISREHGSNITINSNLDVVIDLTNSRYVNFENINFYVPSGYTPNVVFLLARGLDGYSVGDSIFSSCRFDDDGGVRTAFIYNYGSELNVWNDCTFDPKGAALWITYDNNRGITSLYTTIRTGGASTSMNRFTQCIFYGGDAIDDLIYLDENTIHNTWTDCYFGGGSMYAFHFNVTGGYVHHVAVTNSHFEMLGFNSTNTAGTTRGITHFTFRDNTITYGTSGNMYKWFNFNNTDAVHVQYSTIENNENLRSGVILQMAGKSFDNSKWDCRTEVFRFDLHMYQYIRYSEVVCYNSTYVTAGISQIAVNGIYYSTGATFP